MENKVIIIIILTILSILIFYWIKLFFDYFKWKKASKTTGLSIIDKIKYIKGNYNFFKRYTSYVLLIISIIFIAFSIITLQNNKNQISSNTNILFVLDVSKSMNSIDIHTNGGITTRLDFTKKAIENYISKHPNYRYGLVIFAKQAQHTIPLTKDINTFTTLLEGVDYRNLTKQGTDFTNAIKLAIERFKTSKGQNILVIISDGGDPEDYKPINIKIPSNIKTFVFGVGTKKGGKILLGQNAFGEYVFQKYKGNYVITKLNEENLKNLAKDIDALYFSLDKLNKLEIINKYIKTNINNNPSNKNNLPKSIILLSIKLGLFFFLISNLLFFIPEYKTIIEKILLFGKQKKQEKKEKKKLDFSNLDILFKCNIQLRSGIFHILISILTLGIYHFIYIYKRFKLRNCLKYQTINCCDNKNSINISFLIILGLIGIGIIYLTYDSLFGDNSLNYKFLFILVMISFYYLIIITNIIISILYISLIKNKPAKLYFIIFSGWFILASLVGILINLNIGLAFLILHILISTFLFIYGFVIDNSIIKKIVYKK